MSKSFITNILSLLLIGIAYSLPSAYHDMFLYTGLFALSGSITNQIAIHMLFEKVPFLYGSGVIENNFETFKNAIKEMIMQQFFTKEQLNHFFENEEKKIDLAPLVETSDFSPAFEALSKTVMESKFGAAVSMFGGEEALNALKEPFTRKLKSAVSTIVSSSAFKAQLDYHIQNSSLSDDMLDSIEALITKRLDELSPKMVKELVQKLIHKHLGWLVVWGGLFGGLIGLFSTLLIK